MVLALLCFVLFNDCVQPCFKVQTIQPNIIVDLDSLFASDRRNLHRVWYQVSFVYEVEALRGFGVKALWQSMQTPENKCGLTSPHKPGSLFLHLSTCLHQQTTKHVFVSKSAFAAVVTMVSCSGNAPCIHARDHAEMYTCQ